MKERPIIFSGPMVRAILEGRKTETRRPIKPQPTDGWNGYVRCPYGEVGDRLWVREAWALARRYNPYSPKEIVQIRLKRGSRPFEEPPNIYFAATDTWSYGAPAVGPSRKRASITMPRWASRIPLKVAGVRAERLQEIDEAGARAEGVSMNWIESKARAGTWRNGFIQEWDAIYGKSAPSESNPWVWVVQFGMVKP